MGTGHSLQQVGKGTLVRVLPLTLLPAPRTRVPCAYQLIGERTISPGFVAVILGVLASSGLVFAQLQTLGSASHSWPFGLRVSV